MMIARIEQQEQGAIGYAAEGQRRGFYVQGENHLEYLRQGLRGKKLVDAVQACYGLLCSMDADTMPGAYIREHGVKLIQNQIRMAKALYADALGK